MQNENLKQGEVVCKLPKEETDKLKRIVIAIESLDQSIDRLQSRRMRLCELRTDWWENVFNTYLLTRGQPYHINWNTGELIKL